MDESVCELRGEDYIPHDSEDDTDDDEPEDWDPEWGVPKSKVRKIPVFVCARATLPCRIGLGEQPIAGFSNQSKAQMVLELWQLRVTRFHEWSNHSGI